MWTCPLPCWKPSCLSHVWLQMTTVKVRVTLMTGSKVSDHCVHWQGLAAVPHIFIPDWVEVNTSLNFICKTPIDGVDFVKTVTFIYWCLHPPSAHTQRLLKLQSILRRAPSYRTLELQLIEWQERELFEYFVVVSLKKKPSKNSYTPEVTYQFPKVRAWQSLVNQFFKMK